MTGYGKSEMQNDELILSLEMRTLNSRFLDFAPRLPRALMPFEDDALKLIKSQCIRGRIILSVKLDYFSGTNYGMVLNQNKLENYMQVVKEIQKKTNRNNLPTMGDILRLPEIFSSEGDGNVKALKTVFIDTLKSVLAEIDNTRILEGENILIDLRHRMDEITNIIKEIEKIADAEKDKNYQKYSKRISDLVKEINMDENRICQEAAIIAEKKDITEEIVRFNSHVDLFYQYMQSEKNEGKKLNFLLQEMSREVNTIGSKTDFIEINHLVVHLKDSLEKIREQVQNII